MLFDLRVFQPLCSERGLLSVMLRIRHVLFRRFNMVPPRTWMVLAPGSLQPISCISYVQVFDCAILENRSMNFSALMLFCCDWVPSSYLLLYYAAGIWKSFYFRIWAGETQKDGRTVNDQSRSKGSPHSRTGEPTEATVKYSRLENRNFAHFINCNFEFFD